MWNKYVTRRIKFVPKFDLHIGEKLTSIREAGDDREKIIEVVFDLEIMEEMF